MNSRVSLPKLAKGPKKKKRNNKKKEKNSSVHLPAISTSSKDHNAERCTRKNSLLDYIASTKITSQLPSTIMEQEGSKSFRKYYKEVPLTPVTKGNCEMRPTSEIRHNLLSFGLPPMESTVQKSSRNHHKRGGAFFKQHQVANTLGQLNKLSVVDFKHYHNYVQQISLISSQETPQSTSRDIELKLPPPSDALVDYRLPRNERKPSFKDSALTPPTLQLPSGKQRYLHPLPSIGPEQHLKRTSDPFSSISLAALSQINLSYHFALLYDSPFADKPEISNFFQTNRLRSKSLFHLSEKETLKAAERRREVEQYNISGSLTLHTRDCINPYRSGGARISLGCAGSLTGAGMCNALLDYRYHLVELPSAKLKRPLLPIEKEHPKLLEKAKTLGLYLDLPDGQQPKEKCTRKANKKAAPIRVIRDKNIDSGLPELQDDQLKQGFPERESKQVALYRDTNSSLPPHDSPVLRSPSNASLQSHKDTQRVDSKAKETPWLAQEESFMNKVCTGKEEEGTESKPVCGSGRAHPPSTPGNHKDLARDISELTSGTDKEETLGLKKVIETNDKGNLSKANITNEQSAKSMKPSKQNKNSRKIQNFHSERKSEKTTMKVVDKKAAVRTETLEQESQSSINSKKSSFPKQAQSSKASSDAAANKDKANLIQRTSTPTRTVRMQKSKDVSKALSLVQEQVQERPKLQSRGASVLADRPATRKGDPLSRGATGNRRGTSNTHNVRQGSTIQSKVSEEKETLNEDTLKSASESSKSYQEKMEMVRWERSTEKDDEDEHTTNRLQKRIEYIKTLQDEKELWKQERAERLKKEKEMAGKQRTEDERLLAQKRLEEEEKAKALQKYEEFRKQEEEKRLHKLLNEAILSSYQQLIEACDAYDQETADFYCNLDNGNPSHEEKRVMEKKENAIEEPMVYVEDEQLKVVNTSDETELSKDRLLWQQELLRECGNMQIFQITPAFVFSYFNLDQAY